MKKSVFLIRDITGKILLSDSNVSARLNYVEDKAAPKSFETYEEADKHIDSLPDGYYKIEKVFYKKS